MISATEARWGATLASLRRFALLFVRWAVLGTCVVMAWLAGASGATAGNALAVHEGRYAQELVAKCLSASSALMGQTERAAGMMQERPAVEWVVRREMRGEMVAGR